MSIDWEAAEVEVSNRARDLEQLVEQWLAENDDMEIEWKEENYPPRISLKISVETPTASAGQVTRAVEFAETLRSILRLRVFREVDAHNQWRFTLKPIYREVR